MLSITKITKPAYVCTATGLIFTGDSDDQVFCMHKVKTCGNSFQKSGYPANQRTRRIDIILMILSDVAGTTNSYSPCCYKGSEKLRLYVVFAFIMILFWFT